MNDKIACVVVLYRQGLTECETYKTLIKPHLAHIDCLLVFDNSPQYRHTELVLPNGIFRYYHNESNLGLSVNYNRAADFAAEHDYDWLLLLDEDTSFPKHAIQSYKSAIQAHPKETLFAPTHRIANGKLLSPSRPFRGLLKEIPAGIYDLRKYDVINSGLLVNAKDFIAVGGYKPEVNLDFSDYQFLERIRTRVQCLVLIDAECVQDYSNNVTDKTKLLARFDLYCRNAVHFEAAGFRSRLKINYLVFKHTLMIGLRCKSFKPFAMLCNAIREK